jgi:hypothetical protein
LQVEQPSTQARGIELSEHNDKDSPIPERPRSKSRRSRKRDGTSRSRAGDVGKALRSVYDSTLREDVPSDFIDLLGKLR